MLAGNSAVANRNTVKVHFKNLVNDGHLEKEGVGRGVRYRMRSWANRAAAMPLSAVLAIKSRLLLQIKIRHD